MSIILNAQEIETVLDWYEYANSDSFHFGGPDLNIPIEAMLVERLRSSKGEFVADVNDLDLVADWMEKTVSRKYGSAKYLFGFELALYQKIRQQL